MTKLTDRLRGIGVKLETLFRPDTAWKDLDDELRFHLEMEAARLRREGLEPAEARRQAMARFGGAGTVLALGVVIVTGSRVPGLRPICLPWVRARVR